MGQLDNCSRFKSKAKRGVIWATVLVIAVALMLWLCGCAPTVALYPLEGDHIINVAADEEFTASLEAQKRQRMWAYAVRMVSI